MISYVQVEFEEEGDIYEYQTLDTVVAGDFVFVETPNSMYGAMVRSVKVLKIIKAPKYKGPLKFCQKNRIFEMELEAEFNKT